MSQTFPARTTRDKSIINGKFLQQNKRTRILRTKKGEKWHRLFTNLSFFPFEIFNNILFLF